MTKKYIIIKTILTSNKSLVTKYENSQKLACTQENNEKKKNKTYHWKSIKNKKRKKNISLEKLGYNRNKNEILKEV